MSPLAAAIVDHLWQSTVVTALAWLLAAALRRNHARARYVIWMTASAKFLLPFALLISIGATLRTKSVHPIQAPAFSAAIEPVSSISETISTWPATSGTIATSSTQTPNHPNLLPYTLAALWLSGSIFLLANWLRRWSKVNAAVRAATPITHLANIPVLSSPSLLEPGVFGILHPVLVLPEGIAARLTTPQLDTILAHELSHIRRRDNLTAAIHMAVEALFWFHPAVWFIKSRLLEERERACDEAVLQSGNEAEVYAESILNVCKFYIESPLTCVAGVTGSDLKQRIVRIMTGQATRKLDLTRKLLLGLTAAAAVAIPLTFGLVHVKKVHAQTAAPADMKDIVDTWQGTLHAGNDLRTVIKIAKTDGVYKSTFYSIDQGGNPIAVPTTTFAGSTLKLSIPMIGLVYDAKLSPDGKTLTGTVTQGDKPLPLNLVRATPETAWAIPAPRPPTPPMAASADPAFEVATIKPSNPDDKRKMLIFDGHNFRTANQPLSFLISFAYGVQLKQIVGAPAWYDTDKYDITAVPDTPGAPSVMQLRTMIRKLLADRYKLTFHHDKRELSVFVLTVAKSGPKMTENKDPGALPGFQFRGLGKMSVFHATMPEFAQMMQESVLDRPVIDQTSLSGRFDFPLNWTPDDSQFGGRAANVPPPAEGAETLPNLFTALQEQAGLKLDATKAPTDVLVIDHVEKPSEN